jgi:hypothetical protein
MTEFERIEDRLADVIALLQGLESLMKQILKELEGARLSQD